MKIRLMSDLHLEMGNYNIQPLPEDKDTVLILAGDVGLFELAYTYVDFVKNACKNFLHVIYIPGNHEYYKGYFPQSIEIGQSNLSEIPNLSFGTELNLVINDVVFICSTLWTDFANDDTMSKIWCKQGINDFHVIRTGPEDEKWLRKLSPDDVLEFFKKTVKDHIIPSLKTYSETGQKVVVVTHHCPSLQSVPELFKNDNCNGAFASDLDYLIEEFQPKFWLHGHTHDSFDYKIGDTQVVCNPLGYPHQRNRSFNPTLVLEV